MPANLRHKEDRTYKKREQEQDKKQFVAEYAPDTVPVNIIKPCKKAFKAAVERRKRTAQRFLFAGYEREVMACQYRHEECGGKERNSQRYNDGKRKPGKHFTRHL
jgi:hypothetical protein